MPFAIISSNACFSHAINSKLFLFFSLSSISLLDLFLHLRTREQTSEASLRYVSIIYVLKPSITSICTLQRAILSKAVFQRQEVLWIVKRLITLLASRELSFVVEEKPKTLSVLVVVAWIRRLPLHKL